MKSELEKFIEFRSMSETLDVGMDLLPNKVHLGVVDKDDIQRLHGVAYDLWKNTFQEGDFIKTLMTINQDPSSCSLEVHEKLKMTRIAGVILRDANRLFSENHLNPVGFYNFIKALGIYNDDFGKDARKYSEVEVLSIMKDSQSEMADYILDPCTPISFKEYLQDKLCLITNYTIQGSLSKENLHDLRRTSRRVLNLLLLRTLDNRDTDSFKSYTYLRKVNTVLGVTLDENNYDELEKNEVAIEIPYVASELISNFMERVSWSD